MKKSPGVRVSLMIALAAAAPVLWAQDEVSDADLPQPVDLNVAGELLAHSPFTRALNLADSLRLTGIAYVEGRPVATLYDKSTKESHVVSDEPNAMGWKLAETSASSELRRTEVRIMVGPEVVTLHYGDESLAPAPARKGVVTALPDPSRGGSGYGGNGEHRIKSSSYLGENGRERYASLSDKGRDKFKETIHKVFDKHPEMTMDQRMSFAEKVFSKVQAEDLKAVGKPGKSDKGR